MDKKDGYFVWEKGKSSEKLSNYFIASEFECHCKLDTCKSQKISIDLIEKLTWLREYCAKPLQITSGFRCEEHNKVSGGAKDSQHTKGNAADIYVSSLTTSELKDKACHKFFSLGLATNFLHVDTRPKPVDGRPYRLWTY